MLKIQTLLLTGSLYEILTQNVRIVTMYGHDRVIGKCVLSITGVALLYYLTWVVCLPFADDNSSIRLLFPDPLIALIVPTIVFVFLITLTGFYIGHSLYIDYKTTSISS